MSPKMRKELLRLKLRELIREQSEGEWDDKTINTDADKFVEALFPLLATLGAGEGASVGPSALPPTDGQQVCDLENGSVSRG